MVYRSSNMCIRVCCSL